MAAPQGTQYTTAEALANRRAYAALAAAKQLRHHKQFFTIEGDHDSYLWLLPETLDLLQLQTPHTTLAPLEDDLAALRSNMTDELATLRSNMADLSTKLELITELLQSR